MTLILGLESSCDETAAALVEDSHRVLASRLQSQAATFAAWGGVVPEIAARAHVTSLPGLIAQVLADAGTDLKSIDAVAVAAWPGLTGSLLLGVTAAKTIAARHDLPLIAIDHVQAHLAAIHLERTQVPYPLVGLVASGGHSHFYLSTGPGQMQPIGGTIDDAAGEAFDKAASMLGLGYPGGPQIDRRAASGNPQRFKLPRSLLNEAGLRLSFAGLKTALLYQVRGPRGLDPLTLDETGIDDACASFQAAVVDCLALKLVRAAREHQVATIAMGGGVACNLGLRQRLAEEAATNGLELILPEPRWCSDNAAMVAALGYYRLQRGETAGLDLVPRPTGVAGPRAG